jgi:hypothetical protein
VELLRQLYLFWGQWVAWVRGLTGFGWILWRHCGKRICRYALRASLRPFGRAETPSAWLFVASIRLRSGQALKSGPSGMNLRSIQQGLVAVGCFVAKDENVERTTAEATATVTARTRRGELYIPTHRDETAMNGAPGRLWLIERKRATAEAKATPKAKYGVLSTPAAKYAAFGRDDAVCVGKVCKPIRLRSGSR